MKEIISLLQIQDIIWGGGAGAVAIVTLVQTLSKKYKPWSWLAKQFGRAMNQEMIEKIDHLEHEVDAIKVQTQERSEEREKEHTLAARRRILRFADEVRRGDRHSEEFFNNVLEDISRYIDYCEEHKSFENEKARIAIQTIEKAYKHCIDKNDFL